MIRIKELRLEKNLYQQDFAKLIGVSQATLSNWEREEFQPDNDTLIKMAEFFGVSVDYLLGRTDIRNTQTSAYDTSYDDLPPLNQKMLKLYHRLSIMAEKDPVAKYKKDEIDRLLELKEPGDE